MDEITKVTRDFFLKTWFAETMKSSNSKKNYEIGISKTGNSTEKLFQKVTGFARTKSRKDGDFIYLKVPIEVKKVTMHRKKSSGTINQIRCLKNSILVVRISNRRSWLVIEPRLLLKILVETKSRGQHCESPFECSNLTVTTLMTYGAKEISSERLRTRVVSAIQRSKKDQVVNRLTAKLLSESQSMAQRQFRMVSKAL